MRLFRTGSNDVYYNLAFEEYVFENYREGDCLILWTNDKSVVVGKYQNTYEEVNLQAAEAAEVKVARRNTGGGTVFHDKGNLNYSFIMDYDPKNFGKYDAFLEPMIRVLNQLGVPAKKRNNSDIAIGEEKISGSAQTVAKNRILHHGTLLFDADLHNLHDLLKPTSGEIISKSVKSVRSKVVNVQQYMKEGMTLAMLEAYLSRYLFPGQRIEQRLQHQELEDIKRRKTEKYDTWQWNFGRSPGFTFHKTSKIDQKDIDVFLKVEKGYIVDSVIAAGNSRQNEMLQAKMAGEKYTYRSLKSIISQVAPEEQVIALTSCFF